MDNRSTFAGVVSAFVPLLRDFGRTRFMSYDYVDLWSNSLRASYNGYYGSFPSFRRGFDSPRPLHNK